ncbi:beta-ketoacyl-[acyl-carrier-protein] synthase family protein [Opitutus sp. GAS368]|uniref:beta-ketoacyl-[acyl-carrier-protein] synthase family protein n=1 Tax=Opitutus sp. GAS368 TaxID=1882749 RepID=UPI00087CB0D2|nr:beta-ketoacyl-[acyl-carrier-protein] synthase family protein [Opitutus sp. GAS368]SDS22031.1 3-oxoacyl-[acyl-carrier-protein] synthase II [Opitutus sp. GAS368]
MRRRVKITGIGPVTPAGIGREDFFRGINESVSRVRAITRFDPEAGQFIGAEIPDFDLKKYAPEENPRRLSRHTQFSLVAAILALKDAGLTPADLARHNPVVLTGTSIMDFDKIGRGMELVMKKGVRYTPGSIMYEASVANVAGKIVEWLGIPARMLTMQTSCCSGLDAVGQAADLVASGQTDLALCGGSESPLSYYPMLGFNASELSPATNETPEKACRPFDLWRSTGVLGEGACIFVLEPEHSPRPAVAWITGYSYANDQDGQAAMGLVECVRQALANAQRRSDEVNFINAWGTGHRVIDANESRAMAHLYGSRLAEIPVSSIKGAIGTALGASGPIQAASTALSLQQGLIPPTVNWESPDPACPLNLSNQPRRLPVRVAVVNSHGLSGSNAALVVER